ncbi:MAG: FliM/FliN family flagellar motor switch protein [Sphingomonadales bacterium]
MKAVEDVFVEVSVVLGDAVMPISQLLKMGRGAVIDLDTEVEAPVEIFANHKLIAKGEIVIVGENIAVSVTETMMTPLA